MPAVNDPSLEKHIIRMSYRLESVSNRIKEAQRTLEILMRALGGLPLVQDAGRHSVEELLITMLEKRLALRDRASDIYAWMESDYKYSLDCRKCLIDSARCMRGSDDKVRNGDVFKQFIELFGKLDERCLVRSAQARLVFFELDVLDKITNMINMPDCGFERNLVMARLDDLAGIVDALRDSPCLEGQGRSLIGYWDSALSRARHIIDHKVCESPRSPIKIGLAIDEMALICGCLNNVLQELLLVASVNVE